MSQPFPVHIELVSTDVSGGVAVKVFQAGTTTEITNVVSANRRLTITDLLVVFPAGGMLKIVADTDADGRRIFRGTVPANFGMIRPIKNVYPCPRGTVPKVTAPAGEFNLIGEGYVTEI